MPEPSTPFSFLGCFVQDARTFRVVAQVDELKDAGATDSRMLKWVRASEAWSSFRLDWHATRIATLSTPELIVLAVGPAGIFAEGSAAGNREGEVDASPDGPSRRGAIRDLTVVGEDAFVAGMSRQVYRRTAPGAWIRWDEGAVQPRGSTDPIGFNSIHGLSAEELHAVGYNGEIWTRFDGEWKQVQSPANLVLHRVLVVDRDLAFVAGQEGTLLRGYRERWEVIDHQGPEENIWGLAWFLGRLYVAADSGIWALTDEDILEPVEAGFGFRPTGRHLHAAEGVLLSAGPKHVAWTTDGADWQLITP